MNEPFRPDTAGEYRQYHDDARQATLRQAQVPAPRTHREGIVGELVEGDRFSLDGGRTWYVCAVPAFGGVVPVYVGWQRGEDAPTVRADAEEDAACLVGVRLTAPAG